MHWMWRGALAVTGVTLTVMTVVGAFSVWSDQRAGRPMYFGAGGNLLMYLTLGLLIGVVSGVSLSLVSLGFRKVWRNWSRRLQYLVGAISGVFILGALSLDAFGALGDSISPAFGLNGFVPTLVTAIMVVSIAAVLVAFMIGNMLHRSMIRVGPAA